MPAAPSLHGFERRAEPRVRLRLVATILAFDGDQTVRLHDMSSQGANVEADRPPAVGSDVVFQWRNVEVVAQVVWVDGPRCGLKFHEAIPIDYVVLARRLSDNYVSRI